MSDQHIPQLGFKEQTLSTITPGNQAHSSEKGISASEILRFNLMAFPLAFAGLPIYLHAPDFYASNVGLSLASLGGILLLLRLLDAVQDPVIGSLSDRFHVFRHHILFLGTVLLAGGFWMLFHPLHSLPKLWFAASVLICTTGFSIVTINLQTLGGLRKSQDKDRVRITASREALGLLGLLTAAAMPTILSQWLGSVSAFHWLTLAYIPLLGLSLWLLITWLRSAPLSRPQPQSSAIRWSGLLKNPWRKRFFGLLFLNTFASAIPAVLVLFFIRDRLGAEPFAGLFLTLYFLAGAASMPLWIKLAGRLGKVRTWQLSLLCASATFIWAAFLGLGDTTAYAAVCILSGLALGADLALPPAMLADHIENEHCQGVASRLFSLMALLSKSALAVATGLALPLLSLSGYTPNIQMTAPMDLMLSLSYAALPCALKLATLIMLLKFEKDLGLESPSN